MCMHLRPHPVPGPALSGLVINFFSKSHIPRPSGRRVAFYPPTSWYTRLIPPQLIISQQVIIICFSLRKFPSGQKQFPLTSGREKSLVGSLGGASVLPYRVLDALTPELRAEEESKRMKSNRSPLSAGPGTGCGRKCMRINFVRCGPSYPADSSVAVSSLQDFDLSRNKLLQVLETTARCIHGPVLYRPPEATPRFLKYVLSTIASPAHIEVTIVYRGYDFHGVHSALGGRDMPPLHPITEDKRVEQISRFLRMFETFREVHEVREFQSVLCANVWALVEEYTVGVLNKAIAAGKASGMFDDTFSEPLVTRCLEGSRNTRQEEFFTGGSPVTWTPL